MAIIVVVVAVVVVVGADRVVWLRLATWSWIEIKTCKNLNKILERPLIGKRVRDSPSQLDLAYNNNLEVALTGKSRAREETIVQEEIIRAPFAAGRAFQPIKLESFFKL